VTDHAEHQAQGNGPGALNIVPNLLEQGIRQSGTMRRYHGWQYNLVRVFLGQRLMEIGCGYGDDIPLLLREDRFLLATDVEEDFIARVRADYRDFPSDRLQVRTFDIVQDSVDEISHLAFDTVFSSNVLEHIEDDRRALTQIHQVLQAAPASRPRRIVLLLPALAFLHGPLDEALGHFRRYTRRSIRERCEAAGFITEKCFYMNLPGILSWFIQSNLRRRQYEQSDTDSVDRIVPIVETLEKIIPPPIGLTVIYIGRLA